MQSQQSFIWQVFSQLISVDWTLVIHKYSTLPVLCCHIIHRESQALSYRNTNKREKNRYSIQYSQGCSQAECRRRKVRRLLGLAGFGLVMMMEMVVMWAHYTIPLKDICQKDFSACQDGQVKLTLLSHIQPSRKYHDCITMIKNTSFPSKIFSIWIFLTSSWHVRHHVPTSPAFQPLLMWQNAS